MAGTPTAERTGTGPDPLGEAYQRDPAAATAGPRQGGEPVASPRDGSLMVCRHADVRRAFQDQAVFATRTVLDPVVRPARDVLRLLTRERFGGGPILANEPEPGHLMRRRQLLGPLSRPRVRRWEPRIRELARARIAELATRPRVDLMAALLWELPARVVFEVLGLEPDEVDEAVTHAVSMSAFTWGEPTADEQLEIARRMCAYWQFTERVLERRRSRGDGEEPAAGEGWLAHARRAARRSPDLLDERYLRALIMNASTAGHETVAFAAANAVRTLLEQPGAWARLHADPALVPGAVEECLRFRSPVAAWRRVAERDTEVGGCPVSSGRELLLVVAAANRDPEVFEAPDRFDPERENASRHLSFGVGPHRCLGAHLARLQLRVLLEELTAALPGLGLEPGQDFAGPVNTTFHGPGQLWVRTGAGS